MSQLTYNLITQMIIWNCPSCNHENKTNAKFKLDILTCSVCKAETPIDPKRYVDFDSIQNEFNNAVFGALPKLGVEQ